LKIFSPGAVLGMFPTDALLLLLLPSAGSLLAFLVTA